MNLYENVRSNPLHLLDPFGLTSKGDVWKAVSKAKALLGQVQSYIDGMVRSIENEDPGSTATYKGMACHAYNVYYQQLLKSERVLAQWQKEKWFYFPWDRSTLFATNGLPTLVVGPGFTLWPPVRALQQSRNYSIDRSRSGQDFAANVDTTIVVIRAIPGGEAGYQYAHGNIGGALTAYAFDVGTSYIGGKAASGALKFAGKAAAKGAAKGRRVIVVVINRAISSTTNASAPSLRTAASLRRVLLVVEKVTRTSGKGVQRLGANKFLARLGQFAGSSGSGTYNYGFPTNVPSGIGFVLNKAVVAYNERSGKDLPRWATGPLPTARDIVNSDLNKMLNPLMQLPVGEPPYPTKE